MARQGAREGASSLFQRSRKKHQEGSHDTPCSRDQVAGGQVVCKGGWGHARRRVARGQGQRKGAGILIWQRLCRRTCINTAVRLIGFSLRQNCSTAGQTPFSVMTSPSLLLGHHSDPRSFTDLASCVTELEPHRPPVYRHHG